MPITFFDLLSNVIDQNLRYYCNQEKITLDEAYNRIVAEIRHNHNEWFSNRIPNLNYSQPECRIAYLYIVAAINANTFKYVIEQNEDLKNFILDLANNRKSIRVCALGGGPGTELLALAKFFDQQKLGFPVSIDFQLLDQIREWANSWFAIRNEIKNSFQRQYGNLFENWPIIPAGNFLPCDVTDFSTASQMSDIWDQDIYVLNFLLSEIFTDNRGLRQFMVNICRCAPLGSRFVFIERSGKMWTERMERIADEACLELSPFMTSKHSLDTDEKPSLLGNIFSNISTSETPRTKWNIVFSVGIKR